MSSAAATRTSTGNEMRSPLRSIHRRIASNAGRIAANGKAYSISLKRTRRGEVKTRYDASTYSRAENRRVASLFIGGMADGTTWPRRCNTGFSTGGFSEEEDGEAETRNGDVG